MATSLSLRRLWTIYKQILKDGEGATRRDLILAQGAFYAGARGVLKILDYMIDKGGAAAVARTIQRQGRRIKALQGIRSRKH